MYRRQRFYPLCQFHPVGALVVGALHRPNKNHRLWRKIMRSHICFLTLFISAALFAAAEFGEADLRPASRTSKTAPPSLIHPANNSRAIISRAIPGHSGDYQVCETCDCAPCECVDTPPYSFPIHRIIDRIGFKKDRFAGLWAAEGDTCSECAGGSECAGVGDGRVVAPRA